jgi:hypothetical protein
MITAGAVALLGGSSGYAKILSTSASARPENALIVEVQVTTGGERGEGSGHLSDRRSGAAGFPLGPGCRNRPNHDHNWKA